MEDFRRTSACGVFNDPKLFPIPSHEAMKIVSDIRRIDAYGDSSVIACLTYSEAAQLIENYGAAQRQAGREEAREQYKKSVEVDEAYMRTLEKHIDRYTALVEAAKLAKETLEYVKKYVEGQGLSAEDDCAEAVEAINQALSDLGEARRG